MHALRFSVRVAAVARWPHSFADVNAMGVDGEVTRVLAEMRRVFVEHAVRRQAQ